MKHLVLAALLLTGCASFQFQAENAHYRCFMKKRETLYVVDPILNIQWFAVCGDTAEWAKPVIDHYNIDTKFGHTTAWCPADTGWYK